MKERRCQEGRGIRRILGSVWDLGSSHIYSLGVWELGSTTHWCTGLRVQILLSMGMWCSGFSHICPEVLLICLQQSLALEPLCAELGSPSGPPRTPMHWWGVLKGPISGQSPSVRISISGGLSPLDPLSLGVFHHQDPHLWQSLPSPWSCFLRVSLHAFCPWG